jgi:hypothetical protein
MYSTNYEAHHYVIFSSLLLPVYAVFWVPCFQKPSTDFLSLLWQTKFHTVQPNQLCEAESTLEANSH